MEETFKNADSWEQYCRELYEAFAAVIPPEKYRFLQYAKMRHIAWWKQHAGGGAILLGKSAEEFGE